MSGFTVKLYIDEEYKDGPWFEQSCLIHYCDTIQVIELIGEKPEEGFYFTHEILGYDKNKKIVLAARIYAVETQMDDAYVKEINNLKNLGDDDYFICEKIIIENMEGKTTAVYKKKTLDKDKHK